MAKKAPEKPEAVIMTIDIAKSGDTPVARLMGNQGNYELRKESQQVDADKTTVQWESPRYRFEDLFYFMEVNTWHKRAIAKKAALVAGLGWRLETDDDQKDPDNIFKTIEAFLKRPNPRSRDTFTAICNRLMVDYFATGNWFLEVVRQTNGIPAELYHIPGRTMRRAGDFGGYWQVRPVKQIKFANWGDDNRGDTNEVLHHYVYDPLGDYYGIPDWIPAIASMALDRSMVEYNAFLFENDLLAKFAVIIEGGQISKTGMESLKAFLQNNYKQIKNAGRAMVIAIDDPGVKIKIEKLDTDTGNKEMGFINSRAFNRDEVITAHDIPPRMLGIMAAGQLGGGGEIQGQLKVFKETQINPEQRALEDFLNGTIIKAFGEHKWRLKFNEFDITTTADDAEFYERMVTSGIIDTDEAREQMGWKPRPDDTPAASTGSASKAKGAATEDTDATGDLVEAVKSLRKALEAAENWEHV